MLAVSDHPFSDLRVDPEGWLGPTVVSGESQVLQGRLTMNPLRALWGFISRRQALGWWTRKPILPIVRGKSGGRFKRIYRKRTRRSF